MHHNNRAVKQTAELKNNSQVNRSIGSRTNHESFVPDVQRASALFGIDDRFYVKMMCLQTSTNEPFDLLEIAH